MILHPGILALAFGSTVTLLLILLACRLAVRTLRHWDPLDSGEAQLQLERQGELFSVLVRCALSFEVGALFLFLFTVDEVHPLFTGAMCATGVLNLDSAGWWTLAGRCLVCFGAAFWLVLDGLDRRCESAPLVRLKALLLLCMAPLMGVVLMLQLRFFLGLNPEVITSCCGTMFDRGEGLAAELAALPVRPTMLVFYGSILLSALLIGACLRWQSGWLRGLLGVAAFLQLPVALAAVVSFVSLYIYQLPTHHCPFDILQGQYRFIGYPLYLGLAGAVFFGLLPGLCRPLRQIAPLVRLIDRAERRWLLLAGGWLLLFTVLASWSAVFSPFSLLDVDKSMEFAR